MSTAAGTALGARLLWTVGLAVAAALVDSPFVLAALAALSLVAFVVAGRARDLPRIAGPALALAAFAFAINVLAGWWSQRGPLGGVGTVREGALIGAWTAGRLFVTALSFGLLARTTRAGNALDALASGPLRMRGRWGESCLVVALLALRFGPLATAEARRLARAVALRANRRPGLWAAPAIAVPLVLAAVRRADRLAFVLEARHFGAARRTPPVLAPWSAADRLLALVGVALPVAAWLSRA
ncbi:MAG: energy-coupling factor transporter transmembrane component T [Candidatus Eisenbacteria bacterium]